MADLVIVGATVSLVTSSRGSQNGTAGQAINIGQTCYLNTPGNGSVLLAKAAGNALQSGSANAYIALSTAAAAGQPIVLFSQGAFDPGSNQNLQVGQTYCFSNNAGAIGPISDRVAGDFITIIGVAISTTEIQTPLSGIFVSSAQHF